MPIASGAAGRVDVGVDTSLTWRPDGVRRTKPLNRDCDSYLKRYQQLKQRQNAADRWPVRPDVKDSSGSGHHGPKDENPPDNGPTPEASSNEDRPKKSALCVLL